ncbi:uncharacterized protein LACBIDRAFT_327958 [Laccaria bicolor S238N-H82]|uniref:Predicted protein n=1 Tax=Laccaria bicolor (strain S238N-H82 / ATCC MYA-4686) TaxID=486041 RepID=B0DDD0_LACBS|nr:uncharacterized protein LACBIDRAFT_327958 [Laccaria bicolor S238N-H82]EDR07453.1 predicted protein [Laccaria bicolor S238N-H82]|eukprot:XP_001881845.1 predicted protein [Laccaria bicolor S238N-H82]
MNDASLAADHLVKKFQFTNKNYRDVYPALESSIVKSQAGKTVIITGASQGIGKAIALAFAKASAENLILASRSVAKLEATKAEILKINSKSNVLVVGVDTTSEADVEKLEKTVKDTFGHADVLVNNSGQWAGRGNIDESNAKSWWSDLEVNVKGTYLTTQAFLHLLPKSKQGTVITVGSLASDLVLPGSSSYVITKLALNRFNEFVTLENPNVTAVVYHPGAVRTPIMDHLPDFHPFALDSPELAGAFAVYLATERAKFLNGKYASVNWDVEELEARKEDIISKGFFTEGLKGVFSTVG